MMGCQHARHAGNQLQQQTDNDISAAHADIFRHAILYYLTVLKSPLCCHGYPSKPSVYCEKCNVNPAPRPASLIYTYKSQNRRM